MSCVLSTSSCHLRLSQHTEAPLVLQSGPQQTGSAGKLEKRETLQARCPFSSHPPSQTLRCPSCMLAQPLTPHWQRSGKNRQMPNQVGPWEEAQSKGSPVSHPGSDSHWPVPHDMDNLSYKVTQLDQWWLRCFPTFISRGEGRKEKRPCGKEEAPNTPCELRSPQSRHRTYVRSESTHHQIRGVGTAGATRPPSGASWPGSLQRPSTL